MNQSHCLLRETGGPQRVERVEACWLAIKQTMPPMQPGMWSSTHVDFLPL